MRHYDSTFECIFDSALMLLTNWASFKAGQSITKHEYEEKNKDERIRRMENEINDLKKQNIDPNVLAFKKRFFEGY